MNRQETIIRITKINRFVKQVNYWCELNIEINFDVFGEELYSIDQWTAEVHEYLRENPTTALVGMVEDIGSTVTIREYMSGAGKRLPARLRQTLNSYISHMEALQKDCGLLHKQSKGRYANLPDKLANGKAVDLLLRAVKAGYLEEYQPLSETTSLQLKAIAFAVSQLMCFNSRHTYVYFDRLWMRGTYNLSSVTPPRLSDKGYKGYRGTLP